MDDHLTNLLPPDRQRLIRRGYLMRLVTVAVALAGSLIIIAGIFLLPSYVYLLRTESVKADVFSKLQANLSTAEERQLSARLRALNTNAKVLTALAKAPSVSGTLSSLLAIPRPGITLSAVSYTPATGDKKPSPATVVMSGVAATRDSLRSYQTALQAVPFVQTAALPVSAYAQSALIGFSVTLTLKKP